MRSSDSTFDRLLGRASAIYGLWPIVPAAVAMLMAYLSTSVEWIAQFGAFGWAGAFIVTFLLVAGALALIAIAYERWVTAWASRNWNLKTDAVNPLDTVFEIQRINLSDIKHPVTQRISEKTFHNCEFFGPGAMIFWGKSIVQGNSFIDCDLIVAKENALIRNVAVFEDCTIQSCKFWKCTIYLTVPLYNELLKNQPNMEVVTHVPQ